MPRLEFKERIAQGGYLFMTHRQRQARSQVLGTWSLERSGKLFRSLPLELCSLVNSYPPPSQLPFLPPVEQWERPAGHLKSTGYLIFASGQQGSLGRVCRDLFLYLKVAWGGEEHLPHQLHPIQGCDHLVWLLLELSKVVDTALKGRPLPWKGSPSS